MAAAACRHAPPAINGVAPVPAAPNEHWSPPASVTSAAASDKASAGPTVAIDPSKPLTLGEVVDIALRNSPVTRLSWTQARAAANTYGSVEGRYYPTLTAGLGYGRSQSVATPGRPAGERSQYGPTLSIAYTVLDFGGRSGSIDVARQTAVAADLTHNATVENTILLVETAAFDYLSTRALRDAAKADLEQATLALDAATERRRVGLATVADVLQAKTARSQAELALQTLEGSLMVTRGGVAVAMGLPANTPFDMPEISTSDSVHFVAQSVDSLIDMAVQSRPELATARAQAQAAQSQIRVAKSSTLPVLAFSGNGAQNGSDAPGFGGRTYAVNFGISVPVFNGFSNHYDVAAANEQYQAALARAAATKQQVIQQVFTAYYTLRTSTDRVRTSRDLLASATQSETVARERYREGVGSIVDLLIAQSALANARAQSVNARWQWRAALAQLAHDVGVLNARGDTSFAPLRPSQDVRPEK
ncbi:MAG TPA: TolC family protein [Gemmatimonadaceae bacterium]